MINLPGCQEICLVVIQVSYSILQKFKVGTTIRHNRLNNILCAQEDQIKSEFFDTLQFIAQREMMSLRPDAMIHHISSTTSREV